MVIAEIRCINLSDWRGQLRETETGFAIGEEWQANQRGALIGLMTAWIPLTRLPFVDVGDLAFD
ncbi:MAG: hypothetical protein ACX930_13325 [Erythrobacter sp.]